MMHLSCRSKLQVYEPFPAYRASCPYILLVCSEEHSHPIPLPTSTPAHIRQIVFDLLEEVGQDLADMTPRRFLRHTIVQAGLCRLLPLIAYPRLTDLHISLANREHLRFLSPRREIESIRAGLDGKVRTIQLPVTCADFCEGLAHLKQIQDEQAKLDSHRIYVRYVAELSESELRVFYTDDNEWNAPGLQGSTERFRVVICMSKDQSNRLAKAQYLQSDIAFKRVSGWKEFELGGYDHESRMCKCSLYCYCTSKPHLF